MHPLLVEKMLVCLSRVTSLVCIKQRKNSKEMAVVIKVGLEKVNTLLKVEGMLGTILHLYP